ncbi:hypothetical protein JCGZ_16562 [Jatropha curcas]|uniref:RING-type E3 ubiquitin transferase n=1 Tax=Jatropha curcas TaxID=180498 RepID=A0A067K298_JATCU|nr:E3 ubiquitin-protein ligase RFWD3 [Jatropha curcas]XP_037496422.1 E3 ubiquitin-protein ligase RFWD3 [Jatropha curcas]KDP29173.1 hypothetical protein JCGZ_16562 [Jatropha curcas]
MAEPLPYEIYEDEEGFIPIRNSPIRSLGNGAPNSGPVSVEEENSKRRRVQREVETRSLIGEENAESSQGKEWNRTEIDGHFCPICMDAWTSEGDHHICCLPCGHLFGLSCISKWLKQERSSAKCPQCNRKSTLKDIRKLFAPRIAVVDEESQKTIRSLEVKCAALEKKDDDWRRKESEWQRREAGLQLKVKQLTERIAYLEHVLEDLQSKSNVVAATRNCKGQFVPGNTNSEFCSQRSSCSFVLEKKLLVDGARLFEIDAFGQIVLLARRPPKLGGSHVLTKMELRSPHESEDIFIPSSMNIIKDLHISPFNGSHLLCASLGKKLSILSMESNNFILSYDLPAAAWSCSWDLNSSHYIYAGLQNGLLLAFDIRQTGRPVESRLGLTNNPIHTLHSLYENSPSGGRRLLSASSIGICNWNFGCAEERPSLVPQTGNQGVCISVAYCPSSDDIVATYRPRVEMSSEMTVSQPSLTPSPVAGQGVLGSQLHLKRVGDEYQELGTACATVSNIRLPKSVIIDIENQKPLFAAGDEATCGLILQELPSFTFVQRLMSHKHPICDVKYTSTLQPGLLGCLSSDMLQLFSSNLS